MKYRYKASLVAGIAGALSLWFPCATLAEGPARAVHDEMAAMYKQDQDERKDASAHPKTGQWAVISAHDKVHHDRVLELLNQDKLETGDDFFYAAMIMQHGDSPKDYMLAHVLAEASARLGNESAVWLTAASFDRLMLSAKQPQIFGTQSFGKDQEPYKMSEPAATDLIPDSVRKIFHVPSLVENDKLLKQLNAARDAASQK